MGERPWADICPAVVFILGGGCSGLGLFGVWETLLGPPRCSVLLSWAHALLQVGVLQGLASASEM